VVTEDHSIEWDRSDYDPYARTKKFCEHMVRVLLPDVQKTFSVPALCWATAAAEKPRSSTWCGVRVSGRPAGAAVSSHDKIDIVNVDFVADAIATLHQKEHPSMILTIFRRAGVADFS
jgi:hypothetical protein